MKTPQAKIHLLDVAEPLLAFHCLVCRCGLELRNAKPVFMWTEGAGIDPEIILPVRTCWGCLRKVPEGSAKREYLYGLIEAEEALHLEESA